MQYDAITYSNTIVRVKVSDLIVTRQINKVQILNVRRFYLDTKSQNKVDVGEYSIRRLPKCNKREENVQTLSRTETTQSEEFPTIYGYFT